MMRARREVVGSMLRPPELLEARRRLEAGELDLPAFKRIEDRAVDEVLRLQEEAGLDVVTDGEMRRLSFQSQLIASVSGFTAWNLDAFLWGDWRGDENLGELSIQRPPIAVVEPLRRRRSPSAEEFTYARGRTDRTIKVTIPSPSLFANFWDPARSTGAYRNLEDFIGAVAEILRDEVDELESLGCTYVQIDAPHYALFLDRGYREFYAERGWPAEAWLRHGLEFDNLIIGNRPGMTFGFHLCRGNQKSRWLVEGGYEALAPVLFKNVNAERLMLEYDDERSGSFEPLAELPEDKTAVLGLVTTKRPALEPVEELTARIEEASRYCPTERLAISPQCGFATSIEGNAVTVEDERNKLRNLCRAADALWGVGDARVSGR